MNYKLLNEMIDYIEENLTEDIDYKKLSRIVGISEYSLQRIFTFLTEISISEYIRKRRLSLAYEELKTTDIKIIDLAVKYKYDSPISFSRAFKQCFKITPTECRKNENNYKLFPRMKFDNTNDYNNEINYEIRDIEEKIIYAYKVTAISYEDLLYKIRNLYKIIRENGTISKFEENGMYGISVFNNDTYNYYLGSKFYMENTEKITLMSGKYAIFKAESREQKDIVKVYDFVYNRWIHSTNYKLIENNEIEFYDNDKCYIYFKIKDKQK